MAVITGTSDVAVNISGYYDRNLLDRAVPALIHGRYGQVRKLPANTGTRINFRRYNSLAIAGDLNEGVTPEGKKLSTTDVYATLKQCGDFITITDWVSMTGLDSILVEATEVLGEQMGETIDTRQRDILVAGTSVRYANDVAGRSSVATAVATSDLKAVIRTLEGNNAKKIRKMTMAGSKIATRPLPPAFRAITHTDLRQDLESLTGWTRVEEYASQKGVTEEEVGAWNNIRFELTTNAKVWEAGGVAVGSTGLVAVDSTNIDVYAILVFGENAYGTVPLQQGNVKNIVKKMGSAGTDDPLNQRSTSGWKAAEVTKILNDDFMMRVEVGATDV